MSLSRKNSRAIDVDGTAYRWAVSPDSGYINLVVQIVSGGGQRLVVNLGGYEDPTTGSTGESTHRSVTAADVRQVILAAIDHGWSPERPGGELYLHWDGAREHARRLRSIRRAG